MSDLSNLGGSREAADRYRQAVLAQLGDQDPLHVLASTTDELARILGAHGDQTLRRPESPGKWSMLAVAQHLADSELAWSWRLRTVLADERPLLTGYDQDRWAERLGYAEVQASDTLAQFGLLRRLNLRLLKALPEADMARVGLHSERGEESVELMIRLYAGHDLVHLAQLARIASSS